MRGNRLFCNDVEKMIPWRVAKKNTMEKLLKQNPLCINAKLQMPVYVNGPYVDTLHSEWFLDTHGLAINYSSLERLFEGDILL